MGDVSVGSAERVRVVGQGAAFPLGISAAPRSGAGEVRNVAVYAPRATAAWLCLFDGDQETRIELPYKIFGVFHAEVAGIPAGTEYGFRVDGRWAPEHGLRFNPAKVLLDPWARQLNGSFPTPASLESHAALASYADDPMGGPSSIDSASWVPHAVVPAAITPPAPGPRVPWERTVIYELHVGSFTGNHPEVPAAHRGTYLGLTAAPVLEHLTSIGVTAVELLPVQACLTEPSVRIRGMRNHWGYSTGAFFAPDPRFAASPGAERDEFAAMVDALHGAGIEVLMDVVYNHTAEAGVDGPVLSLRGLDPTGYYLLDGHGRDIDYTGCANTLACDTTAGVRLVLDSLRFWATEYQVDGFRFDLASVLGRGKPDGVFDRRAALLTAIACDPVLADRKLIAEPWDATAEGYQVGGFGMQWAEWNDRYRDTVRQFWTGAGTRGALASRTAGSQDIFERSGRAPFASINFVTAHDGFTAADVVSYATKHNEANGEDNRDGSNNNYSVNHGIEGTTDDADVLEARARHVRALLATLLLSTGTPMLLAGDEIGHSQGGNNNAYCVPENASAAAAFAIDWGAADTNLAAFVARLTRLRRAAPILRQHTFFSGRATPDGLPDLAWFDADGEAMSDDAWHQSGPSTLQVWVDGTDTRSTDIEPGRIQPNILSVMHSGGAATITLGGPANHDHPWELLLDSSESTGLPKDSTPVPARGEVTVSGQCVLVYRQVEESNR